MWSQSASPTWIWRTPSLKQQMTGLSSLTLDVTLSTRCTSRIAVDGGPSLSLVRGRLTWIKAHLVAGTPLAVIRKFAGPVSMNTLTHLLGSAAEEIPDEVALIEGLRA